MRLVVALGGNALLHRGEPADASTQRHHVTVAAREVAELAGNHDRMPARPALQVEAACRFGEATGGRAAIGAFGDAAEILGGQAGTTVAPGRS